MKKLLITTVAAVSVGLCAKAVDDTGFISGTSFEGLTEGEAFDPNDTYWTIPTDTDDEFKITNVTYSADATKQHWDWTDGEKALSIDTANPILRNVNPAQDVTTPVFFDSVVQFTATDVVPSIENNTTDKLVVWLYSSPEDVATTPGLFGETSPIRRVAVTAGYLDGATLKTKNYITNIEVEPDTWHRLTIKSFKNDIGDLLFNIWVDRTQVSGTETFDGQTTTTDFLSRISDAVNSDTYNKLQAVAFDGKGAVDDIVFTTTVPDFAKEGDSDASNVFNVVISTPTNAEIIGVMDPNDEDTPITGKDGKYSVPVGTESIIVAVTYAGTITNDGAEPIEEGTWAIPVDVSSAVAGDTIQIEITAANAIVTYPTVKPEGEGAVITQSLSDNANKAIQFAFAGVSASDMPTELTVYVNGEKYVNDEAIKMINEAVEMFTLANNAKFFNEYGVMEISFMATNPFMETETAEATDYDAKVGKAVATVTSNYTVNKETVNLTPGAAGENEAVTFKLVIKPVGSTGSDTGSAVQE